MKGSTVVVTKKENRTLFNLMTFLCVISKTLNKVTKERRYAKAIRFIKGITNPDVMFAYATDGQRLHCVPFFSAKLQKELRRELEWSIVSATKDVITLTEYTGDGEKFPVDGVRDVLPEDIALCEQIPDNNKEYWRLSHKMSGVWITENAVGDILFYLARNNVAVDITYLQALHVAEGINEFHVWQKDKTKDLNIPKGIEDVIAYIANKLDAVFEGTLVFKVSHPHSACGGLAASAIALIQPRVQTNRMSYVELTNEMVSEKGLSILANRFAKTKKITVEDATEALRYSNNFNVRRSRCKET